MPLAKFRLRSVYRHHINHTDYSYMKVKFQSGTPTKIAFDGLRSQRRFTGKRELCFVITCMFVLDETVKGCLTMVDP